jgi:hypothetical protein
VRKSAPLSSALRGGGQESNRRAGTENVAGIAGFGAAAVLAASTPDLAGLRDGLEFSLVQIAPAAAVFGAGAPRLSNTSCISMPGVPAETQVVALDLADVCISAGAACSSGRVKPSSVLEAMGVLTRIAQAASVAGPPIASSTDDGGAGHGSGLRDPRELGLEYQSRRHRMLDRGVEGLIFPSEALGYFPGRSSGKGSVGV